MTISSRARTSRLHTCRAAGVLASLAMLTMVSCAGRTAAPASGETTKPALELPASAAPAKELAPLAFMTGRWIGVNPNKTVNEEHWTAARGSSMLGTFRQIRRDGKPAFVELSLITVEGGGAGGVVLRLRHLHGLLEVPPERANLSIFKMKSAGENRVEFAGTGEAAEVTGVVYRLVGPDELAVDISFAPNSREKGFTSIYTREPGSR